MALFLELTSPSPLAANPRMPLGERPLRLGRAPDNDLVLPDASVSWHHASVGVEPGGLRVRDHGSTNGTWIDDTRVDAEATLLPGQVLRLGRSTELRVVSTTPFQPAPQAWRLEVVATGVAVAVPQEGLRVGMGGAVGLSLALSGLESFVLHPTSQGAWIEVESGTGEVRPGAAFTVGGVDFRLMPADGPAVPTVGAATPTDHYRLRTVLVPQGAEAVLEDPTRGLSHRVSAENRAVLLYILAGRLLDDRAARVPPERQGWCGDDELAAGVWGREAARMQANNLNVLVHRLRRELEVAGFDTAFFEKRSRALRLRLVHVTRE